MKSRLQKIALGGGCHWCTEAVFQALLGVEKVEQGFVSSNRENSTFSEAVIVHFNSELISLKTLIEIHLYTHKSTSNHSMRAKYRSAVYVFLKDEIEVSQIIIRKLQPKFEADIITEVLPFIKFKASRVAIQNYYQKNPEKPFCQTFINPKLIMLLKDYSSYVNSNKLAHLKTAV